MRKAFFGGSFDPPHYGHLGVAEGALRSGKCDTILWAPAFMPPHKLQRDRESFFHRYNMLKLITAGVPEYEVSDIEYRRRRVPSYTFDILEDLNKIPGEEYLLLIGADSLLDLHTWHRAQELAERFEFLTGASYDAFLKMSDLAWHYKNDEIKKEYVFGRVETGNAYIKTDIFLNVMLNQWLSDPREDYFKASADWFLPLSEREGKWQFLYKYCFSLFNMMRLKSGIVERLTPAYKSGDKETLKLLCDEYLPAYYEAVAELSDVHAYHKDTYLRPFGTELVDAEYGRMKECARTALRRIRAYLDGKIDSIPELSEKKLDYQWGIFF